MLELWVRNEHDPSGALRVLRVRSVVSPAHVTRTVVEGELARAGLLRANTLVWIRAPTGDAFYLVDELEDHEIPVELVSGRRSGLPSAPPGPAAADAPVFVVHVLLGVQTMPIGGRAPPSPQLSTPPTRAVTGAAAPSWESPATAARAAGAATDDLAASPADDAVYADDSLDGDGAGDAFVDDDGAARAAKSRARAALERDTVLVATAAAADDERRVPAVIGTGELGGVQPYEVDELMVRNEVLCEPPVPLSGSSSSTSGGGGGVGALDTSTVSDAVGVGDLVESFASLVRSVCAQRGLAPPPTSDSIVRTALWALDTLAAHATVCSQAAAVLDAHLARSSVISSATEFRTLLPALHRVLDKHGARADVLRALALLVQHSTWRNPHAKRTAIDSMLGGKLARAALATSSAAAASACAHALQSITLGQSTALGEAVALAETLVDLVVANQNDVAVTQPALCALANLSTNRDLCTSRAYQQSLPLAVAQLRRNARSEVLQRAVFLLAHRVLAHNPDALVQLGEVLAEELYTLVVEAMDMHAASKPVQLAGCLALLRLGREAFVDETASAVVLVALNGHAYDTAVVELAACTLTVVLDARVESCRQRGEALVALGGLTIMARAIDALRSQGDALVRLLAAVRQLLLVCPAAARKLPVSFVESVRESWASNPTNERVLVTVLDLLVLAYHEHAMWPSSGRAPLVAWAVHVLRCYARRDDVQARCLWLLSALCVDDETRASVKAQRRTIHAAVAASVAASPDAASAWRYLRVYAVQGSRPPVATAPSASPASVARTGATAALSAGGAAASAAAAAGTRRSQMSRVVVLTPDEQAARDTPAPAAAAAVAAASARALADLDSKLQAIELRSSPRRTTPLPVGNAAAEGRAARGASHSFAIVSSNAPGLPSATLVTQGVMPGGALALRASAAASPTPPDTNPGTLLAQRSALGPALAAAPPSLPASAAAPADRLAAAAPLSATAADDLRAPSASGVIARPRDALYGTMASPARRAALHGPWRASTDADDDADALEDELRARLRADASDGTEAYVQSMLRATSTAHVRDTLDTLFPSLRPVVRAGAGAGVAPS